MKLGGIRHALSKMRSKDSGNTFSSGFVSFSVSYVMAWMAVANRVSAYQAPIPQDAEPQE